MAVGSYCLRAGATTAKQRSSGQDDAIIELHWHGQLFVCMEQTFLFDKRNAFCIFHITYQRIEALCNPIGSQNCMQIPQHYSM
jgi:hypothetical protein